MTRCKEFYIKVEREGTDWCEKCPESVRGIENYLDFVNELAQKGIPKETSFLGISETAARPLISERDPVIKEKAIESVKKALETKKSPSNGRFSKKLTEKDVQRILTKIKYEHLAAPEPLSNSFLDEKSDVTEEYEDGKLKSRIVAPAPPAVNVDAILARNREEIAKPGMIVEEIMDERGIIPMSRDERGLLRFDFACKGCGCVHLVFVNIEGRVAVVKRRQEKEEVAALGD